MNSKSIHVVSLLTLLILGPFPAHAQKDAKPAAIPEGGERHIYKTVGDVKLPLYLYAPEGHTAGAQAPAIVFFFGGGWKSGSPRQFQEHCRHLAEKGMVAITAAYRVSSRHDVKIDDCIADAKSAMRWVRAHADDLGIDPDRIASGGGSAGGHLAAAVAVFDGFDAEEDDPAVSARPNAMVLFNPALAIAANDRLSADYNAAITERLVDRSNAGMKKVSPLSAAAKKQPPCVMFFGTADKLLHGAEVYRDVSKEAGNQCEIVLYEGMPHGFFNFGKYENKYYDLTVAEMDQFLESLGWIK